MINLEKEEVCAAIKTLTPSGFALFMWLAAHPCNIQNPMKIVDDNVMPRRSYYRAIKDLQRNKYLVDNIFYPTPKT